MSAHRLRVLLIVLAVIGIGLAGYLTYVHYAGLNNLLCGKDGGTCAAVQSSKYSKLAGVSVALIGLIGYVLILGTLLLREEERTRFATAALTLGGFGFSAYLTYREIFTLEKICEWCAGSALLLTIMTVLSAWRFLREDPGAATDVPAHTAEQPAAAGSPS
ncbi:MAG: vitamin K epoxide reductase family protein [Solirubrobacteraceae bacterium]